MGPGNCGLDGCRCTTAIMDCAVHRDSQLGRAEAFIVSVMTTISEITDA